MRKKFQNPRLLLVRLLHLHILTTSITTLAFTHNYWGWHFLESKAKALWTSAYSMDKAIHLLWQPSLIVIGLAATTLVPPSGNCFMIGHSCVSWLSKKQPTVATSSCETKYSTTISTTVECLVHSTLLERKGKTYVL